MIDRINFVKNKIRNLKIPKDYSFIPRLPVKGEKLLMLRPLPDKLIKESKNDALLMAKWRKIHLESFSTVFQPTEAGTKKWLKHNYFNNYEDIIFFIETNDKIPFGHVSLYNFNRNECEFGRVIKGFNVGPKGSMAIASMEVINWGFNSLKLNKIYLEVFADNERAVNLYFKLGFSLVKKIPCILIDIENKKMWVETNQKHDLDNSDIRIKYLMEIKSKD